MLLLQDPGGWIIIQRRTAAKVSFVRNMASYKKGFGKLRGDFWLGLYHVFDLSIKYVNKISARLYTDNSRSAHLSAYQLLQRLDLKHNLPLCILSPLSRNRTQNFAYR